MKRTYKRRKNTTPEAVEPAKTKPTIKDLLKSDLEKVRGIAGTRKKVNDKQSKVTKTTKTTQEASVIDQPKAPAFGQEYTSPYITVKTNVENGNLEILTSNNVKLGLIQSFEMSASVGNLTKCKIQSLTQPQELKVLQEEASFHFVPVINGFWSRLIYIFTGKF
jgi:hypothetical protein